MCIDEQGWHKKQDLLFEWPDRLSSYACLVYARQYLLLQDVAISNVSVSGFVPPLFTHGKNALCRPESCREKKINTESLGQTDRQTDRRVEVPVVNFTKSRGTISAPWKQCWMTKWISHFVPKQVPGLKYHTGNKLVNRMENIVDKMLDVYPQKLTETKVKLKCEWSSFIRWTPHSKWMITCPLVLEWG